MTDLRFRILWGYLWDWGHASPPGKIFESWGGVPTRGEVGGRRWSLAWMWLVPASLLRKPGAELPAKGTRNGRRLEDNTETRKRGNKQRYQRRDKNNKTIITVLLSWVYCGLGSVPKYFHTIIPCFPHSPKQLEVISIVIIIIIPVLQVRKLKSSAGQSR